MNKRIAESIQKTNEKVAMGLPMYIFSLLIKVLSPLSSTSLINLYIPQVRMEYKKCFSGICKGAETESTDVTHSMTQMKMVRPASLQCCVLAEPKILYCQELPGPLI